MPGSVIAELLEGVVAEKEMGLEACWMSQVSSSSCGVSTSARGYMVGLCRNIATSSSSLPRVLLCYLSPGRSPCSPPLNQHGRRRESTLTMRLEIASHSLLLSRSKRLRVRLLALTYCYSHLQWIALSSEEMARSAYLQSALSSHH